MNFTVDDYLSVVESQHKPRPKFMAVLRKYLEMGASADEAALDLLNEFSLDADVDGSSTVNKQLDIIGQIVGVSREYPYTGDSSRALMTNDQYKLVLRATIARNHWDGSFHSFADTWNEVFAGLSVNAYVVDRAVTVNVADRKNMACRVYISGDFDEDMAYLIRSGFVFPKPMGVEMEYAISGQSDRTASVSESAGACLKYVTGITSVTAIYTEPE